MSEIVDRPKDYHLNDKGTGRTNVYKKHGKYNSTKFRYSPHQKFHSYKKYHYHHHYYKKKREKYKKKPSRPSSPLYGTEEYAQKKIQETSDIIKKQLMMPFELINNVTHHHYDDKRIDDKNVENTNTHPTTSTNSTTATTTTTKNKTKPQQQQLQQKKTIVEEYDVNQIHEKIISHISNLSFAKKINLICSTSSGYDAAIHQIQKQKRLELSKALRDMCSEKTTQNTQLINSIIPDIGIEIEQLPVEIIQELSKTLDLDFANWDLLPNHHSIDNVNSSNCVINLNETNYIDENREIKTETINNELLENSTLNPDEVFIKTEIIENIDDDHNNQNNNKETAESPNHIEHNNQTISIKTDVFEDNFSKVEKYVETTEKSVQTELNLANYQVSIINNDNLLNSTTTLTQAIDAMEEIDGEILRLTKLRQRIFYNLKDNQILKDTNTGSKRKISQSNNGENVKKNKIDLQINNDNDYYYYDKELNLGNLSEKILIIKIIKNNILAGAESGNLFFIDLKLDRILKKIQISTTPLTSLIIYPAINHLFIGCLDSTISEYDILTKNLIKHLPISSGAQCLEISWNYLFIGTNSGNLIRYSLQKNRIEFEENISITNILVLKATQEGARKVLLIGTRNSPICIRDALSGLHMRTMDGLISPTVYTLLLENSLVYCGTTSHDILVFSFHDGNLLHKYNASNSKGIGCMKIVGNLLFASCYNGNIYVYHKKTHEFIGNIQGPGGVVLSMEIVNNLVIVGTICFKFKTILIPDFILKYNKI